MLVLTTQQQLLRVGATLAIRRCSSGREDLSYGRNRWLVNRVRSAASHSRITTTLTSTFSTTTTTNHPSTTNRRTRPSKANTPKPTRRTQPNPIARKRKRKAPDNDTNYDGFFRKRNRTAEFDQAEWEEMMRKSETKHTANPQARQAKKPKPEAGVPEQFDNKYVYNANGWDFEATVSEKYKVVSEVKGVTTKRMHHVCAPTSFFLADNEFHKLPTDGPEVNGVTKMLLYSICDW
jgi:hypothetical protein